MTIAQLQALALEIRNETMEGANTHIRIGDMFLAIINALEDRQQIQPYYIDADNFICPRPQGFNTLNVSQVTGQLRAAPIVLSRVTEIAEIAFEHSAASGINANLAMYLDNGNYYPGDMIPELDFGTVSLTSAGLKSLAVSPTITLQPGLYWFVWTVSGNCNIRGQTGGSAFQTGPLVRGNFAGSDNEQNYSFAFSFGTLPDPFPGGAARSAADSVWPFIRPV